MSISSISELLLLSFVYNKPRAARDVNLDETGMHVTKALGIPSIVAQRCIFPGLYCLTTPYSSAVSITAPFTFTSFHL
jgi:hypothetical protein